MSNQEQQDVAERTSSFQSNTENTENAENGGINIKNAKSLGIKSTAELLADSENQTSGKGAVNGQGVDSARRTELTAGTAVSFEEFENQSPSHNGSYNIADDVSNNTQESSPLSESTASPRSSVKSNASETLSVSRSFYDFSRVSTPLQKNENLSTEFPYTTLNEDDFQSLFEERAIKTYEKEVLARGDGEFSLDDIIPIMMEGVESVVKDSFTECFTPREVEKWNFNWVLFPLWCIGVFIRYCFILPARIFAMLFGTAVLAFMAAVVYITGANEHWMRWLLQWFGALWALSLSAVVRYHGVPPVRRKNQLYVANHTSLIDFIILSNYRIFSTVGQKHPGFIGFLQDRVIFPLRNIFFERFELHDRNGVPSRITEHINNIDNPPLLIFPEGVCVNNEYCLMFKKGVFELENIEIVPIAIKYNKLFSDPYWSSRDESFLQHILRLMRAWCTVANVYFLEPQKKLPNESAVDFANRVKEMIAKRAGLINLHWDGYLKYYTPSIRLMEQRQKQWAERLKEAMARRVVMKNVIQKNPDSHLLEKQRKEEEKSLFTNGTDTKSKSTTSKKETAEVRQRK